MNATAFYVSVRFTSQVDFLRHEPDHWIMTIEGHILVSAEQDDELLYEERDAGTLRVLMVMTTQAINDGLRLSDVFDAHSGDLANVYEMLFDPKTDEPKLELEVESTWEGLLYLDKLELNEGFRHTEVAVQAIEVAVRCFCPGGIIAAHRCDQLDLTIEEWKQLGFRKIPKSIIVVRDNTMTNPYGMPVPGEE